MKKDKKTLLIITGLTIFSVFLVVIRVLIFKQITFIFLLWNLILAWIPYLISYRIIKLYEKKTSSIILWITIFIWYIFFPNSPYILTDLIHLSIISHIPKWYDGLMIFSFSFTALILGFLSLEKIQKIISEKFSKVKGWIFTAFIILSSGFGIYLGRFLRWNTWDIFINPQFLITDILERIIFPFEYIRTIAVTVLFSIFIFLSYLVFTNNQKQN